MDQVGAVAIDTDIVSRGPLLIGEEYVVTTEHTAPTPSGVMPTGMASGWEAHTHTFTPQRYPEAGLAGHNYCRAPDGLRVDQVSGPRRCSI